MAGKTILIIDDDSNIRKMTSVRLEREGYRVLTASRGDEGLALAQAEHPDAILVDVVMPGMDGREVLRHLQADPAMQRVPVILLTVVNPMDDDPTYAPIELNGAVYQSKPYKPQELLEKLRTLLATASSDPQSS